MKKIQLTESKSDTRNLYKLIFGQNLKTKTLKSLMKFKNEEG